jgi:hypothetical protein
VGQRRGTGDWRLIITTVALVTLVGAGALFTGAARSVDGVLYQEVYPPAPDSPFIDPERPRESLNRALADADLDTEFRRREDGELLADDEPLIEHVPYTFVATVTLASRPQSSEDAEPVKVGVENDATLQSAQCDPDCGFSISPATPQRRSFNGRRQLQWDWAVRPRVTGNQTLILEIQPVLILEGSGRIDLRKLNEPIRINVEVHPNRAVLAQVREAAENVELDIPNELVVDRPQDVTVTLPLPSGHEAVRVGLRLVAGQNSVPTSIVREQLQTVDNALVTQWTVTPEVEGPLDLMLAMEAQTNAGDLPLEEVAEVQHASRVLPRPPTFAEWIRDRAVWLTTIVAVPIALLTLWNEVQKRRRRGGNGTPTDGTTPGS